MIATERYKGFPPGWGHIFVPLSSRRNALAALALFAACSRRALLAQRAAWLAVKVLGTRMLVGAASAWTPPMGANTWQSLLTRWSGELTPFDTVAIYHRMGSRRGVSALLLRGGQPIAFARVATGDAGGIFREREALRMVSRFGPTSFSAPQPLTDGMVDGWAYLTTSTLPPSLHRPPVAPPLEDITGEISAALSPLPRDPSTPAHWRAMHGDFTPWNLRQVGRKLFLYDWEEVAWAPPDADRVLYAATTAALRGRRPSAQVSAEAARFWAERVRSRRPGSARDQRLSALLLGALTPGSSPRERA